MMTVATAVSIGDVTWLTVRVGLVSTALMALLAIALGYLLARRSFRGKSLVQTLVMLPMVLPPVAVGVALLLLLGQNGVLGAWLNESLGVRVVFTWWGAAIAAAIMSFPLLVRASEAAFGEVPRRLEHVASSLGASRLRVFFAVTLPLAKRGVAYGLVLAFTRGIGEFGATILVAGNIPGETTTLALGIYSSFDGGDDATALSLIGVSVVLAFVSTWIAEGWLRRRT